MGRKDVALTLRQYVYPDQDQHRTAVVKLAWDARPSATASVGC
jgi:hypothetical protein